MVIRKLTDTETDTRSGVTAVTKPDHVVLKPLELFCGRNLEKFGEAS
jgi:hypothetical protein